MIQSATTSRLTGNTVALIPALNIRRGVLLFAKYSGLFALARVLSRRKTRVLAYHGIWLGEGHFGNYLFMSAEKFAARMALLEKWGYPVVAFPGSLEESNAQTCPTVITIDDGWYGTWSGMLPALEKHGYPATVYLTTYYCLHQAPVINVALNYCFSVIDTDRGQTLYLPAYDFGPVLIDTAAAKKSALTTAQEISASLEDDQARQKFLKAVCDATGIDHSALMQGRWFHIMNPEEVRDAASRGIQFESHTHHHRITHRGKDSLAKEISINSDCIREMTGRVPEHFCYPSGRFTKELWPVLEQCRIVSATTTDIGLVDEKTPCYAMPRIVDGQDVSELEFEAEMSGFMELTRLVRRAGRNK